MLLDPLDPTAVLARSTEPFLRVGAADAEGQVGNVCFAQGLVLFRGEWRLYLGLADSRIGCAVAPGRGGLVSAEVGADVGADAGVGGTVAPGFEPVRPPGRRPGGRPPPVRRRRGDGLAAG